MLTVRHVAVLGVLTVATAIAAGAAVTVDEAARLRSVSKETFLPGLSDRVGGVTKIVITRGADLVTAKRRPAARSPSLRPLLWSGRTILGGCWSAMDTRPGKTQFGHS